MTEADLLLLLRGLPLHPGARGLRDDAAVVAGLVITTDTLVEGVHFPPGDPPGDVAWKLLAVNLSDLAAKGAEIEGVLLNYPLSNDIWDRAFLSALGEALVAFGARLIGGDTVSLPPGARRILTCTAIGRDAPAPSRTGAREGDRLWVTGTIGDAGIGLKIARDQLRGSHDRYFLEKYRRPTPRLTEGRAVAPIAHAMSDISDGLLIDAHRMAVASGLSVKVDLARMPVSTYFRASRGIDAEALVFGATAGDDYELLFALGPRKRPPVPATLIGRFLPGSGLALFHRGKPLPLPARLGFQHGLR